MVWACDAKGRDPHNKKQVEHDGDGNPTQRTSKDEMAWQTESHMRIYGINPEMATDRERWAVMVNKVDTSYMIEDGNG